MNPFRELLDLVLDAVGRLQAAGELPPELDLSRVAVEPPRDPAHGEAATNAALVLAKAAGKKPLDLATRLAAALEGAPGIARLGTAAPGFVNLTLTPAFWQRQILTVLEEGPAYGRSDLGEGQKINVEYCSANPTGPLHVGHGRGTVFGDALANVLAHAGYRVTREYYINDGGAQIETLARSLHLRYREALGEAIGPIPTGLYPGEYLIPVAQGIAERDGDRWLRVPEPEWLEAFARIAVDAMMARIRDDLDALGVHHDVFTSERALIEEGRIDEALAFLESQGLLYTGTLPPPKGGKPVEDWEPAPQLLFRATAYGDEIDRPLKRSNGAWTYFAADLAYHLDKFRRGFDLMVDVWGADHGGYVKRMQAAVKALSQGRATLDVRLCQLVNLLDEGRPLKMSKRAGRIVTLRDVVDEVGRDVVRFIMLTRKNDAPLDFDLARVTEQSKDNPVFYVQYAHARICSVFRNAAEEGLGHLADPAGADLSLLRDPAELLLVREMASFPRVLEGAALHFEPHRIAFYLHDLAGAFHGLWTRGKEEPKLRFLLADQPELTRARLAMLAAVRSVIATGLGLMGVRPVEELH
ncbi:arginine--tRNA ligase [Benzoatithermus flavus]|uniref:Arginine--tRNA ligase n=1 Tax=Benzoatithermus flavus TaxID=3108223 RepID=A0ABU8XVM3_9PROT